MFDRALNRLRRQERPDPEVHLESCALCGADFVNPATRLLSLLYGE